MVKGAIIHAVKKVARALGLVRPRLSVLVVAHNMDREVRRTLRSLSATYQRGVAEDDYEVILIDNGSSPPLDPGTFSELPGNFRLIRITDAPKSPASAINRGIAEAKGEVIGLIVDGSRIATPGLLRFAIKGADIYPRSVVTCLGWYLGSDLQSASISAGYDEAQEDALLKLINWPNDGYRLFEIGALDESSLAGWFGGIAESNALFMRRALWGELHGADERFDRPGGGFLNLDIFKRAVELPETQLVILLGEGTFHQVHNGIATNAPAETFSEAIEIWHQQYADIRGERWRVPSVGERTYIGVLPQNALPHVVSAAAVRLGLSAAFAPGLIASVRATTPRPGDPSVESLLGLAEEEFAHGRFGAAARVARIARVEAANEPAIHRVLSHTGYALRRTNLPAPERVAVHLAAGQAYQMLGNTAAAKAEYEAVLAIDNERPLARIGLAGLRMPGDGYLVWLERLQERLRPEVYLEIGVANGRTLALAQKPTVAIAIDIKPNVTVPPKTEAHIFVESSDAFFARGAADPLISGKHLGLSFIDGSHVFADSLRDFINVEKLCGPGSVVTLHDTVPFDELTQRAKRKNAFYTGDVWKTVLCLRHYRPELEVFTIATPWSGLTVVAGFDEPSTALSDNYDEAVKRFDSIQYTDIEDHINEEIKLVANDWDLVARRLQARGITLHRSQ